MKKVIYGESQKVPAKIWTDDIEVEAQKQVVNVASLPFVFKHVAIMPDVHAGWGATIGSVIATKNAVIPSAVGVDIGCGMMAVKTDLHFEKVQEEAKNIRHSIERSIPLGHNGNSKLTDSVLDWHGWNVRERYKDSEMKKAMAQLGSLGGGNHFIEICLDTENNVWVMLHSGSRGIGNILAKKHIEKAKSLIAKYFIDVPDPELAYLVQNTQEFDDYIRDLLWAQDYAKYNRIEMMNRVIKDLSYAIYGENGKVNRLLEVNCHHNYCEMEHHFGENVWVTRKGAVRARVEDYGIIPGSMGAKSFIVKGKGNLDSFNSCSHGAGRKMSRTKARASFTREDLEKQTDGIECRKDEGVLDEIPGAYKDIEQVMENQKDLVEVVAQLKQIICVKG